MVVDINSVADLDILKQKALMGEEFQIGTFRLADCLVKLDKGRFESYKVGTFDEELANIILEYQKSYRKFLKGLKKEFDLAIPINEERIVFSLSSGSLEVFAENLFSCIKGAINKMESKHIAAVLSIAILAFAGTYSWDAFMDCKKQELIKEGQYNNSEVVKSAIEALEKVATNKNLGQATNSYKKTILDSLDEGETASFSKQKPLTRLDSYKFDTPEEYEEVETIEEHEVKLLSYNFRDKSFRIKKIGNANSDVLSPEKRIRLIAYAENKGEVRLQLKFIKNQENKILKTYILDYIP